MSEEKLKTKVITGLVRFSYLHVFTPQAINDGDEKKYSVSLIIPKDDKSTLKKIENAIEVATQEGKAKFGGKIPAKLKLPLRDGDEERQDDAAYENSYFISASAKTKPVLINAAKEPITDEDKLYSGCYGFANINFYAFNTSGNKGIACGLNALMKKKDGEPLSGAIVDVDDFDEVNDTEEDDFL